MIEKLNKQLDLLQSNKSYLQKTSSLLERKIKQLENDIEDFNYSYFSVIFGGAISSLFVLATCICAPLIPIACIFTVPAFMFGIWKMITPANKNSKLLQKIVNNLKNKNRLKTNRYLSEQQVILYEKQSKCLNDLLQVEHEIQKTSASKELYIRRQNSNTRTLTNQNVYSTQELPTINNTQKQTMINNTQKQTTINHTQKDSTVNNTQKKINVNNNLNYIVCNDDKII